MYYLNYFFIMSFIGHFLETFVYTNGESGILFGIWTPVYGVGTVVVLLLYNLLIKKLKLNKVIKFILVFLIGAVLLSIIEALGGYLIQWIFKVTFWDYSDYRFNMGKYIALEMALIWGIGSIIIIYIIKPLMDKIISKIPKDFTYFLTILLILDLFLTVVVKH